MMISSRSNDEQDAQDHDGLNRVFYRIIVVFLAISLGGAIYNQVNPTDYIYGSTQFKIFVPPNSKAEPEKVIETVYSYENLLLARAEVKSAKDMIWNRWNVTYYPDFLETMHVPNTSFDIQVWKFQKLLLEHDGKSSFVVGFTGSSVTAGHDNYFNESYPIIFEKVMASIFAIAGIRFEVRNGALGNNPCLPYDACVTTHMGNDLDILTWEQSMNCGHDTRPLEIFTRSSLYMQKRPTVMYFLSGTPTWTADECSSVNISIPSQDSTRSRSKIDDIDAYKRLLSSSRIMDDMTFLHTENSSLHKIYSGLAPMGQSVQGLLEYKCQGPYTPNFADKSTGKGAKWHPGWKGHLLRADSILYPILSMLEEALRQVYLAKLGGIAAEEKLRLQTKLNLARIRPQASSHMAPVVCSEVEECGSEPKCFSDYLPRKTNSLSSILVDAKNPWDLNISLFDFKSVQEAERDHRGYLDKKMVFLSKNTSALLMRVNISRKSPIWLCQLQKGFLKYPSTMGELNEEATVNLYANFDHTKLAPIKLNLSLLSDPKSSNIPKGDHICFKTDAVPQGSHVLSLEQKGSKQVSLSYVLFW